MNKKVLLDYVDACKLVEETEEDIKKLRKQENVHDKVSGSNPEFPYQPQSFNISGIKETNLKGKHLQKEKELLIKRKENAEKIKVQAEEIMREASLRMQRIIRLKIFEQNTWEEVAAKMGGKCTNESLRKEFERFLQKK